MPWLESAFPGLNGADWRMTSPPDREYNCIAWAAGDNTAFWWPVGESTNPRRFWPADVPQQVSLPAFIAAFATIRYSLCDDDSLELGFEKIALFADADGAPTHAALQLLDG